MEKTAIIISIVSLIATALIAIWQIITNININKINIKSNVCEKIFDEYLITKIPVARKFLKFDCKGKLTGWEKLNKTLVDMKLSSLYFKYNDKVFYEKLDSKLMELEDYIVSLIDKKYDSIKHPDIYNKIDEDIKIIYNLIDQKRIKG